VHLLESFADLEVRIAALPTQRDRGDAFEVFAEAYLTSQKIVEAEEVWPADQVPIAVLEACHLPVHDMGADGIYRTFAGHRQGEANQIDVGPDFPDLKPYQRCSASEAGAKP